MLLDTEYWRELLTQIGNEVARWVPSLAGALVLLAVGWIAARLSQALLAGILRRLGLDRLAAKAGIQSFLDSLPSKPTAARVLARLVYYVVLLVFVMAAVESLGLTGVTETLGQLVSYLPNVIAATLIVLVGALFSRLLGDMVGALTARSGMAAGPTIGSAVYYVSLVVVTILALQRLGVDTALLVTLTISLITAVAFAVALAFGLGNRELARNIMAGLHAKDEFQIDQRLRIGALEGRLLRIGPVKSAFDTEGGEVSVPNLKLIEDDVLILEPSEDAGARGDAEGPSVD